MTSVVSEEFRLAPDVAGRQDYEQCARIMELRRYRDVKSVIESATKDNPPPPEVSRSSQAQIWNQVMLVKKQEERR